VYPSLDETSQIMYFKTLPLLLNEKTEVHAGQVSC
jgi:hypothetical protein